MAEFESLIDVNELKTDLLISILRPGPIHVYLRHDQKFDSLMILFVSPTEVKTFVHYIDDEIALLCDMDNSEVVGFQIEAFKKRFLPKHENINRVWSLKESGVKISDLGDLLLMVERSNLSIAREVTRVTQEALSHNDVPLKLPTLPMYELA